MELIFNKEHRYAIDLSTRRETGNSTIYKAVDIELGRSVCIKQVDIYGNREKEVKANLVTALNEVRAMVRVASVNNRIPQIYSTHFDEEQKKLYIIMQWIEGTTLRDRMNVDKCLFLKWMEKICDILADMAKFKMSHKDIKPENIMIDKSNDLYLIDFNISISTPNVFEGTQHYKAPEMDNGSKSPNRDKADMFSLGVIMYEFFTGQLPVKSKHYGKIRRSSEEWDMFIKPVEINPDIPDKLNEIICKSMSYQIKNRYKSYWELKHELYSAERSLRYGKGNRK